MNIISVVKKVVAKVLYAPKNPAKAYYRRFKKYAFSTNGCQDEHQYEAVITKLYHSIEKGLSYSNYRPGFGRDNIERLIAELEKYAQTYDVSTFFYQTALCTLAQYVRKNKEYGHADPSLEERIHALKGEANTCGGAMRFEPYRPSPIGFDFDAFVKSRHSIREFSSEPVDIECVKEAIELAQNTPSACNRQGWKTRVVCNPDLIKIILNNQNGNRGFGDGIATLLVVTGDLRYFSSEREIHQVFIDGGMYAMNLLHSLHHKNIATIPLSASLRDIQEKNVRNAIHADDAEILIMFIGLGNYPEQCITTRSARKPCEITVLK